MIAKLLKLVGGGSAMWIYGACVAAGIALGGYSVHKLYQASQTGQLKAEISRIQEQFDEKAVLAQESHDRELERVRDLKQQKEKIYVHITKDPKCDLSVDAVRMLNRGREQL